MIINYNFITYIPKIQSTKPIRSKQAKSVQKMQAQKKQQGPTPKPHQHSLHLTLSNLPILVDLQSSHPHLNNQQQTDLQHQLLHNPRRLSSQVIEQVPLKFNSVEHYRSLWERLFFEECRCQIYRAKEEEARFVEGVQILEVTDYANTRDWKAVSVLEQAERTPNMEQVRWSYCLQSWYKSNYSQPQRKINYPHIIGFIQSTQSQSKIFSIKVKFPDKPPQQQSNYPVNLNNTPTMSYKNYKLMTQTKDWYLQQITPITTLQRQYNALCCIAQITPHLLQIILQPDKHVKQMQKKFRIPNKLDQKLKKIYNDSQYKAINQCLRQTGVTLIQGPPGTGKTKTVIGTLSILLNSYRKTQEEEYQPLVLSWNKSKEVQRDSDKLLNPWLYTGYTDWRDQPYIDDVEDPLNLTSCYLRCDTTDRRILLKNKQEGVQLPEKVLICGPSNASVDQIIRKLIKQQLLDADGKSYLPNFVRVGQHYDQSLKQYSLDYLAEKLAEKQHGADLNMYKNKILNQYRLIFATLSAAGNQIMQNSGLKFDTVVIDQAGQSIQISNLIPLLYGCQRLILIGDPNQLPATVFSEKSIEHKYDQSLFERLMKSGYPVNILKMQYRMHPDISAVIGAHFYGQKLTNWENIIVQEPKATSSAFVIFHMEEAPQISYKKSFRNMVQAKAVKQFALYLSKYYQDIGIISPYSQQVSLIQSLLPSNKKFQTKTIDSFQGRQKQVIVFSTVRSRYAVDPKDPKHKIQENKRKTIGFVNDLRRINVSLSRARNLCVIFGDAKRLAINAVWKKIILEAIDRGQVFVYAGGKGYFESVKDGGGKHLLKSLE